MVSGDKPLVWLHGEVKTPPLSTQARVEAGYLLRLLQKGETVGMPWCRALPTVGPRCHELRINDKSGTWRVVYRVDEDAIVIAEVFQKRTRKTPTDVVETCRRRLRRYDASQ